MNPRTGRPPKSDYITLTDAAKSLGVSRRTVERMMDRGELSFRRTRGGHRKLHRSGVEDFIALQVDKTGNTA